VVFEIGIFRSQSIYVIQWTVM